MVTSLNATGPYSTNHKYRQPNRNQYPACCRNLRAVFDVGNDEHANAYQRANQYDNAINRPLAVVFVMLFSGHVVAIWLTKTLSDAPPMASGMQPRRDRRIRSDKT
jgi:hypothetical protein